jgi:hypothetical protein
VATPFSWLTLTDAQDALLARLNAGAFWSAPECKIYLFEALKHWNGLCEIWNEQLAIPNAQGQWINLGTLTGSPRLRTITDQNLYSQMCWMLLEPQLSAGVWAGTSQFTLANLQYSLQKRCQEVIQATSCNMAQLSPINATPGVRTGYTMPDTTLEARRNRFFALLASTTATAATGASTVTVDSAAGIANGQAISGAGIQAGTFVIGVAGTTVSLSIPTTGILSSTAVQFFQPIWLTREDALSFQSFQPEYLQEAGYPMSWAVASQPPLSFDVDLAPTVPGYFDLLALNAGPTFTPPTASLLGVPDDWSMVPMYGALADVLGQEPEGTDRQRSAYCLERYTDMTKMMGESNWLLQTLINGRVSYITSLADMDALAVNWQQSNNNLPSVIEAGMDFIAPIPGVGQSLAMTVVANAPLLDSTNTYVQVSRDDWEAVLDYAQHLAVFKRGGSEFAVTMPLLQSFYRAAAARNSRWSTYGPFTEMLRKQGEKQNYSEPRMAAR